MGLHFFSLNILFVLVCLVCFDTRVTSPPRLYAINSRYVLGSVLHRVSFILWSLNFAAVFVRERLVRSRIAVSVAPEIILYSRQKFLDCI